MGDAVYTWPAWMPAPEKDNFTREPVDTRTKSEMEAGTVLRAEYDTDEQQCTCTLTLDEDEAAWFESFEHNVLRQGVAYVLFPCWIAGQLQYQRVRFGGRPKIAKIIGQHSQYTLTLYIERRDLWSADVAIALLYYTPDDLGAWSDAVDVLLSINMPGTTTLPGTLPWS